LNIASYRWRSGQFSLRYLLTLDSFTLAFRLSHRVEGRIYWTKVSINTSASDDHLGAYAL
jgi:hypothetical protein